MYRDIQKVLGHSIFQLCTKKNVFHIKPHFFKTLFQSQFVFNFEEMFTNKSENVCSFL